MNIEDIKKNAPEYAQYYFDYGESGVVYFRKYIGLWMYFAEHEEWEDVYFRMPRVKPLN